jgi:hypothetical protein
MTMADGGRLLAIDTHAEPMIAACNSNVDASEAVAAWCISMSSRNSRGRDSEITVDFPLQQ